MCAKSIHADYTEYFWEGCRRVVSEAPPCPTPERDRGPASTTDDVSTIFDGGDGSNRRQNRRHIRNAAYGSAKSLLGKCVSASDLPTDGARFELARRVTVHTLSSREYKCPHTLKATAQVELKATRLSARHPHISIVCAERSYVGNGVCTRDRASCHRATA